LGALLVLLSMGQAHSQIGAEWNTPNSENRTSIGRRLLQDEVEIQTAEMLGCEVRFVGTTI
jgi:hypothetical protein